MVAVVAWQKRKYGHEYGHEYGGGAVQEYGGAMQEYGGGAMQESTPFPGHRHGFPSSHTQGQPTTHCKSKWRNIWIPYAQGCDLS